MKSSGTAYLLALLGFLTPAAGVHRFYLGRPISGLLYLLTWGFLGVGTMIDLFLIARMVDDENRRLLFLGSPLNPALALLPPASPEQQILRIASEKGGVITVELVALHSGMSLQEAKKRLEQMRKDGFCSADLSSEGAKLYVFEGLRSITPFALD